MELPSPKTVQGLCLTKKKKTKTKSGTSYTIIHHFYQLLLIQKPLALYNNRIPYCMSSYMVNYK